MSGLLSDAKKSESLVRSLEIEVPATNASADLAESGLRG